MKLGVALSGGGARGAIHLGILHSFEEHGIVADMYAGTSAGAIVSSAKAMGFSHAECLDLIQQINNKLLDINYLKIITGIPWRFKNLEGIMKGKRLKSFLDQNFDHPITDVLVPLSIVSSDMNAGKQVIFSSMDLNTKLPEHSQILTYSEGISLSKMIYSSSAIQGIFPPLHWGSHSLGDGSIVNNLPANLLNIMGADKIVAINISTQGSYEETHGIISLLGRAWDIMIDQNMDYALANSKDYLCLYPKIPEIRSLDFDRTAEAYEKGYAYGLSVIEEVQKFIQGK
jgi:NTE family protein